MRSPHDCCGGSSKRRSVMRHAMESRAKGKRDPARQTRIGGKRTALTDLPRVHTRGVLTGVWHGDQRPPPCPTVSLTEDLMSQFGTAQQRDPEVQRLVDKVAAIDGKRLQDEGDLHFPYFAIRNSILYWVCKRREGEFKLLVVPRSYQDTMLHLPYFHFLGGHLGWEKTAERVLTWFY